MGKKAANTRYKKRSKKQPQSVSMDSDDDSDSERPLSAYACGAQLTPEIGGERIEDRRGTCCGADSVTCNVELRSS